MLKSLLLVVLLLFATVAVAEGQVTTTSDAISDTAEATGVQWCDVVDCIDHPVEYATPLPIVELAPAASHVVQPPKYQDAIWIKLLINEIGYGAGADYTFSYKKSGWWSIGIHFPRVEELQAELAGPVFHKHGWPGHKSPPHPHRNLFRKVDETNAGALHIGYRLPLGRQR